MVLDGEELRQTMELGTTGAILTFALQIEDDIGAFYEECVESASNSDLRQAFEEIQRIQKKRQRLLSRFRRENVTEMILEPIHGFDTGRFEFAVLSEEFSDDSSLRASAVKIEENLGSFYNEASEKTMFLPEVSEEFKRISDKSKKYAELLKSLKV